MARYDASATLPVDLAPRGRCHTNKVPCHTDLGKRFADFLDGPKDVVCYFKNERLGFSVTYYRVQPAAAVYQDFFIAAPDMDSRDVMWLAETKDETRQNAALKHAATRLLCEKMSLIISIDIRERRTINTFFMCCHAFEARQGIQGEVHCSGRRRFAPHEDGKGAYLLIANEIGYRVHVARNG